MNRILAILAFIATAIAVIFGYRSKADKAEADAADQRADIAEAANDTHTRAQTAREKLNEQHAQENTDVQDSIDRGDRDHLDNNW